MKVVFLGTSSMVPTKERNPSTVFLEFEGEGILFDCGEGTQRQMNIAKIKRTRVTRVLISHWHGDHVGGLLGLIQTISSKDKDSTLFIYGPKGTKNHISHLLKSIIFDKGVTLKIMELVPKKIETFLEEDKFIIQCAPMNHRAPCIGYSFIEKDRRKLNLSYLRKMKIPDGAHLKELQKGKDGAYNGKKISVESATKIIKGRKLTFITDSIRNKNCIELADKSNLFICESTYEAALQDKAEIYMHMTSVDAAKIAKNANVEKLVLTHFSQRYKEVQSMVKEAKTEFSNVVAAKDFMKIEM